VQQSFPDLARAPCREKIVIEGKYLRKGGYEAAQSDLVKDFYRCFFAAACPSLFGTGRADRNIQAAVTVTSAAEASALAMYIAAKTANRQPALNLADDN
jgi:hypothetical protein